VFGDWAYESQVVETSREDVPIFRFPFNLRKVGKGKEIGKAKKGNTQARTKRTSEKESM